MSASEFVRLLTKVSLILIGLLFTSSGCGPRDTFAVVAVSNIPQDTEEMRLAVRIGSYDSVTWYVGQQRRFSFYLPNGVLYWDDVQREVVGHQIQVQIIAIAGKCLLASGTDEQTAKNEARQELHVLLASSPDCPAIPSQP